MAEERSKRLQERFSTHNKKADSKQKSTKEVDRGRHSLYLDKPLVERVDKAYKDVAHKLYPLEIDKATFMEACLTFALENLDDIQALLVAQNSPENE